MSDTLHYPLLLKLMRLALSYTRGTCIKALTKYNAAITAPNSMHLMQQKLSKASNIYMTILYQQICKIILAPVLEHFMVPD